MTTTSPSNQGPFLCAALLCERLLLEQDGVSSAIRIIDRVTRTVMGSNPPEEMEPFEYEVTLVIILKAGWTHGSHPLRLDMVKPPGETQVLLQQTVFFEGGEDRGVSVVSRMRLRLSHEGLHWFEVFLEGRLLTKIPMRVVYQRLFTPQRGESEQSPPGPSHPSA